MNCVNCGRENPNKALICYWCALDPVTGENPYTALRIPATEGEAVVVGMDFPIPAAVVVPSPMEVPSYESAIPEMQAPDMTVNEVPTIEIPSAPGIPDFTVFSATRRRARLRPIVRVETSAAMETRPVLPGCARAVVFTLGAGLLVVLVVMLLVAIAGASLGGVFCVLGLLGLVGLLWVTLFAARTGKRIVAATGESYERLEVMGRVLREVVPGVVQELPINLAPRLGVLDQPVAYSELRALAGDAKEPPTDQAVDLLIGAIASLVGRDDVLMARRTYPVETRGKLTRPTTVTVDEPVLTRRRIYTGPGELEGRIARSLRTDYPITVEDLLDAVLEPNARNRSEQIIGAVNQALSENPPDLEALSSPESALAEFDRFRKAFRRADPELYAMLEDEIRNRLAGVAQRSLPSSFLDAARYVASVSEAAVQSEKPSDSA
jgi:hypothetical protein